MLCFEGIALNLNVYLQRQEFPTLRLVAPVNGDIETMIVHTPVGAQNAQTVDMK